MSWRLIALTALLAVCSPVAASSSQGVEVAAEEPSLGTDTVHGCYSSLGELTLNGTDNFNSQGACAAACRKQEYNVGASRAKACYCGNKYPPENTLVNDSQCNEPCPGYGTQACGGSSTYTIYNTGVMVSVESSPNVTTSSSSSAASTTTSAAAESTAAEAATTTPTESTSSKSKSNNSTVGIAVGTVVGVVVVAAVVGGIVFYCRRRRNQNIEDEHRRNAAVNAFIANGGKPPGNSGGMSIADQRLDPVMAHRRVSNGSIADNEDYSRRILRVTNA